MPKTAGQGGQGDPSAASGIRWSAQLRHLNVNFVYLHKLAEAEVEEQTTAIRPRARTHLSNLKVRHLANDLPAIPEYQQNDIYARIRRADLVYRKIDCSSSGVADDEVLRRLKVVQVVQLRTVHRCRLGLRDDSQAITPRRVARARARD